MKKRILVVEDEYLIAFDHDAWLRKAGFDVVGPVSDAEDALRLVADEPVDAAILDIELHRQRCFAVGEALQDRGVPFAFLTGFTAQTVPSHLRAHPVLLKPTDERALLAAIHQLVGAAA